MRKHNDYQFQGSNLLNQSNSLLKVATTSKEKLILDSGDKMPRSARKRSKTGIYHIMFRDANRQEIFHDDEDRMKFIGVLERCKEKSKTKFYAWCLMSNHVHLLLKEGYEDLSINYHETYRC